MREDRKIAAQNLDFSTICNTTLSLFYQVSYTLPLFPPPTPHPLHRPALRPFSNLTQASLQVNFLKD